MHDVKSIEIFFRRVLLRALKLVVKRKKPLSPDIDLNTCKILFIRQDRIGDVLISTPIYTLLKKHYPDAVVDFLLSSKNQVVLENEPLVRKRWVYTKSFGSIVGLMLGVRREKYDFVVDLMDNSSTTSTIICLLANGSRNIGLCKENAYIYDISVPLPSRKDIHIVERTAQVLTAFNIDPKKDILSLHYAISEESARFAQTFLKDKGLLQKPILGINISPAQGNRHWGNKNYHYLIEKIIDVFPSLAVLVLYQPSDTKDAEEIARPFKEVTLSTETRLFDRFASLIKHCSFLITPDTSAVHLASAFHIPTVALYVQPNKNVRIWEPYGVDSESLVSCGNTVQAIDSLDVFRAFERLYSRHNLNPQGG